MVDTNKEVDPKELNAPPVCGLCWDWILPGEAIDVLEGVAVHARCYKMTEAY